MEKSIEQIWKDGFINEKSLIIPKLNNLYNQKSIHLIDRFKSRFKLNYYYIIFLAFFMLAMGIVIQAPITGSLLFLLLLPLVFISKRNNETLLKVEYSDNSYEYIKTFDIYLKEKILGLGVYYQIFYPAFVAIMIFGCLESAWGDKIIDNVMNNPNTIFWNGIPIVWTSIIVALILLATIFAKPLYKFDIKLGYGSIMQKLDELVKEMEELRK